MGIVIHTATHTATPTTATPTQTPKETAQQALSTNDPKALLAALHELEDLLKNNPDLTKTATKIVRKETQKEHPQRISGVKQYTRVHKITHCMHCSYSWDTIVNLSPKDYVAIIDRDGHPKQVHFSTIEKEISVQHYVVQCPKCVDYVHRMYREELEFRYLNLLNEFSVLHAKRKVWNGNVSCGDDACPDAEEDREEAI